MHQRQTVPLHGARPSLWVFWPWAAFGVLAMATCAFAQAERPDYRLEPDKLSERLSFDRLTDVSTNDVAFGSGRLRTRRSSLSTFAKVSVVRPRTISASSGRTDAEQKRTRAVAAIR
jgi:hypothetical protein